MTLNPSRHFLAHNNHHNQHHHHHHQLSPSSTPSSLHYQPAALYAPRPTSTATSPFPSELDFDLDLDLDLDLDHAAGGCLHDHYNSVSSSPVSTQSILSHYSSVDSSPLSAFDSIPTPTLAEPALFPLSRQSTRAVHESPAPFFAHADAMQTESWMPNGQLTPRSVGRFSHQRDASGSSIMSSNGPVSPFAHNMSHHPQIAMNESADGFQSLSTGEDLGHYQLAAPKSFPGVTHDNYYAALPAYATDAAAGVAGPHPYLASAPRRRHDRSLIGPGRSQPVSHTVSVASSVASDSPATPAGETDEERRRGLVIPPPVKLERSMADRTMADAYQDELYSPNFTLASSSSGQASISPTSDLFNQRLQAANNQHLTAVTNSPVSATSRDRSPFRQGSPLAPSLPMHDFSSSAMGPAQVRFGSAQQLREQSKAMRDAQVVQQQMARSAATSTPQTISPKDAMLEFHEPEGEANFPLFPPQGNPGFNAEAISRVAAAQSQQVFSGLPMDTSAFGGFLTNTSMPSATSVPAAMQLPPQFPFLGPRPQSAVPSSLGNVSVATTRFGSVDTGATESVHSGTPQRPLDTRADGGTYTCTYHGCTLRFDTPALLQKHKREGHRQAHGLNGARRPDVAGMTSALLNTQSGPHRCDRINPSTGKPCSTVFSRPYDLTRHEDTIHNARKQKVRCDLCTDEKTFSRADALTRHYRVCHPDVEFPGKQRRRGGHSSM